MVWVPIALSRDVPRGTTRATMLEGQRLVVRRERRTIDVHDDTADRTAYAATETGGMIWINRAGITEAPPVFLAGLSIATLPINGDWPAVRRLLGNPVPHGDAQLVDVVLDGVALMIGWHVPAPGRVVLHVTSTDPGNIESRALLALHRLRAQAEATS